MISALRRWRWGHTSPDNKKAGDASSGAQTRTYVLRPAGNEEVWQGAADGRVLTWYGGSTAASRMTIRMIAVGDEVLLLNGDRRRALVGVARVIRSGYPAPSLDEPSRLAIDLEPLGPVTPPILLNRLRTESRLNGCGLLRIPTPEMVRLTSDERRILKRFGVD